MSGLVQANSLVTLNFRISQVGSSVVMMSTFESRPATMQLGAGELMPALETRLIGLAPGAHEHFQFAPGEAFGPYNEDLVERIARQHIPPEMKLEQDAVYAFPAPDGSSYPGLVRELGADFAVIDFNHPMAGKAVCVEVEIVGII